jgi:RimJ/RimL family protein N-acetyltransferase
MRYLFYCFGLENPTQITASLPDDYEYVLWRPSSSSIVPSGVPITPFAVWWGMHQLKVFANQDYGLFLIYHGRKLVHRSGIFPRYFRFPFMGDLDLQVGDTWTTPEYRGRGLATFALGKTVELCVKPGRKVWYVVAEDNYSSVRVVKKVGFALIGRGIKKKRLGVSSLGSYVIQSENLAKLLMNQEG